MPCIRSDSALWLHSPWRRYGIAVIIHFVLIIFKIFAKPPNLYFMLSVQYSWSRWNIRILNTMVWIFIGGCLFLFFINTCKCWIWVNCCIMDINVWVFHTLLLIKMLIFLNFVIVMDSTCFLLSTSAYWLISTPTNLFNLCNFSSPVINTNCLLLFLILILSNLISFSFMSIFLIYIAKIISLFPLNLIILFSLWSLCIIWNVHGVTFWCIFDNMNRLFEKYLKIVSIMIDTA